MRIFFMAWTNILFSELCVTFEALKNMPTKANSVNHHFSTKYKLQTDYVKLGIASDMFSLFYK